MSAIILYYEDDRRAHLTAEMLSAFSSSCSVCSLLSSMRITLRSCDVRTLWYSRALSILCLRQSSRYVKA